MKSTRITACLVWLCMICTVVAQKIIRKSYEAVRTFERPLIDGRPFESIWDLANDATDFMVLRPENGQQAPSDRKTVAKILYDNNALYVAAYLYGPPEIRSAQFSQRDQIDVQADLFAIWINTYDNQLEQFRFYVTAAGTIGDAKAENGQEDFSYEVVFKARTSTDEKGWYVEMEIPYQALRFPERDQQNWSFNLLRRINDENLTMTYNYIDISTGNEAQYDASLDGIRNLDPPLRLSLFPYTSIQGTTRDEETALDYSLGMDLKYGVTEAFTLDATLVPDFGQVGFDELELNLGPFEQTFEERRPFFTEGTELFQKGNIFFSRRIGQASSGNVIDSIVLQENEVVTFTPDEAQLVNALKFTGRTKNKLGIGILNAITAKTQATIRDTLSGGERGITTNSLTNYNVLVLDQQYGANSSVYLSAASTLRSGSDTDALVMATGIEQFDRANRFRFNADIQLSNRFYADSTLTGLSFETGIRRIEGKWRYGAVYRNLGSRYDPNDLGLNLANNINSTYAFLSHNQFTPKGKFNSYSLQWGLDHNRSNAPNLHRFTSINFNPNFQTRTLHTGGAFVTLVSRELDIFESRLSGYPVRYGAKIVYGAYLTTDTRKKLSMGLGLNSEQRFRDLESRIDFSLRPSYRVNDRLFMRYALFWQKRWNRLSYVGTQNEVTYLSRRNTRTIEHTLQGVYNISNNMAINIRLRNFWSSAGFADNFLVLDTDGRLSQPVGSPNLEPDVDFNVWNMDINLIWRFAPASDLTLLYRNNLSRTEALSLLNYSESLERLFDSPLQQVISLRFTYFLDVNKLVNQ